MTKDDPDTPVPVPAEGPGSEIVAHSRRELEQMSDAELLGEDYAAWLARRKMEARTTVTKGYDARLRAEEAMAKAEEILKRAEAKLGK